MAYVIPDKIKNLAIELGSLGTSHKEIAKVLNLSMFMVKELIPEYNTESNYIRSKRSGRWVNINAKELRDFLHKHPHATLEKIGAHFDIPVGTLSGMLKKLNVTKIWDIKPLLSKEEQRGCDGIFR